MKIETLKKRLEKRYTGSKSQKCYQLVAEIIENFGKEAYYIQMFNKKTMTIRPVKTSGHGRFTSLLDYSGQVEGLLDLLGVKYESGNDAPRGGRTGYFIHILTKFE